MIFYTVDLCTFRLVEADIQNYEINTVNLVEKSVLVLCTLENNKCYIFLMYIFVVFFLHS